MRNSRLADKIKIMPTVVPSVGAAAGMTEIEVDGSGFSRALWVVFTGAAAAGATLDFKVQSATATGGSFTDVASALIAQVTDTGGSKMYGIDMAVDPAKPFMKPVGVVGTDTFANACFCILYRGSSYPVATSYLTQLVQL